MKLLKDEEKLVTSNADKIILTNYRIHLKDAGELGQSFSISIFLENISSIEVKYKSNFVLLIIAAICLIGAFLMNSEMQTAGLVSAAICIVIWWFTRKHIISISSNGGSSLNFEVQGMGEDKISDFIYHISEAKLNRVNQLHKI